MYMRDFIICIYVYFYNSGRFTISIMDLAPIYYFCNYIFKDQECQAMLNDTVKDFAMELVNILSSVVTSTGDLSFCGCLGVCGGLYLLAPDVLHLIP